MAGKIKRTVGLWLTGGCALGLAAGWAGAGMAASDPASQPSAKEIHDRLLGHDSGPAPGAQPAAPAGGSADCSTQEALESNPACFNQVSGANRSFSLVGPSGQGGGKTAPRAAPPTAGRATTLHAGAGPAPRRPAGGGGGAAASCGLRDTSNDRGVNLCVTFGLNSAVLTPQSRSSLNRLVEALSSPDIRGHTIRIEGYADVSGNAQANQKLSEARAESVAAYLVQRGVSRDHVESQGYGATHLLPDHAPTDPANRRVEARLKN